MSEEDIIRQHDSGKRPFTTPDGYFNSFTDKLMERMKQEGLMEEPVAAEEPAVATVKAIRLNPMRRLMRYAAAAVVAGVCVAAGTYLFIHDKIQTPSQELADFVVDDDEIDDVLDYELVDNSQIAYYLTEAY